MDRNTFIAMPPQKRVQEVNKLLQKYDLKDISKLIGIPSSTFSKLIREGDYLFHQGEKKYYPFVRSEEKRIHASEKDKSDEVIFIRKYADTLKRIV